VTDQEWNDQLANWTSRHVAAKAPEVSEQKSEVSGPGLGSIVLPNANDRWMSSALRKYKPEEVARTLAGALSGDITQQYELFDLMEETARISKNLNQIKDSVLDLDRQVQAWAAKGQKPTPEAERRARLVDEVLCHMRPNLAADENDLDDTIYDLLDAKGKGVSLLEIDWADLNGERYLVETTTGLAVGARCTRLIHPRYYGWPSGSNLPDRLMLNAREIERAAGMLRGARSMAGEAPAIPTEVLLPDVGNGFAELPPNKFLLGIKKSKSGHPIKGGMLRTLGFWWAAANFAGEWFVNYAQIFGMPIRWATYDTSMTPSDRGTLQKMLQFMGSSAWAMFPAGTSFELKEAQKAASDNPQMSLLEFFHTLCDIVILGQTLTSDVGDSGSRALGSVHENVLGDIVCGLGNWVGKILTRQLIEPICLFNFGDLKECPWLSLLPTDNEDPKAKAERFKILIDAGARIPEQWFAEQNGLPVAKEGEAVIERAAPTVTSDQFGDPAMAGARGQSVHVHAKYATDRLIDNTLEDLTGVQAAWLGGAKPFFRELIAKAKDTSLTDEQFVALVERASREIPELASSLNPEAVATALERSMGAAVVNGAVKGFMKRRVKA
jgi:phage gp29-like protein